VSHRIGDDPSGQTIYDGDQMVAVGCTPQTARDLVARLNSEPARQQDVDLLSWLLAEMEWRFNHFAKMAESVQESSTRAYDQVVEERDAARVSLAFWSQTQGM
jgi:hypothetical protein